MGPNRRDSGPAGRGDGDEAIVLKSLWNVVERTYATGDPKREAHIPEVRNWMRRTECGCV